MRRDACWIRTPRGPPLYSAGTGFRGSAFITRPFNKIVITEAARVA